MGKKKKSAAQRANGAASSPRSNGEKDGEYRIGDPALGEHNRSYDTAVGNLADPEVGPPPKVKLRVRSGIKGSEKDYVVNSRTPQPFESDMFIGNIMIKAKTDPEDEYFKPYFKGRQRMFEIQFQGKFKKLPDGELYMGVEGDNRVALGFFAKGMANGLLTFAGKLTPGLHHHFGSDEELAHITMPLVRSCDRLIRTPEGEEPPFLGVPMLPETVKADHAVFDLTSTYSISFHSMYVDFCEWKIVKLPMFKDIQLSSVWGNMAMHFVCYALKDSDEAGSGRREHLSKDKEYLFDFVLDNDIVVAAREAEAEK